MPSPVPKLVKGIILQRKKLLQLGVSGKNEMKCYKYIAEISKYIDAYSNKWNDERWHSFVLGRINEIKYLIPENKAGQTTLNKLYESITSTNNLQSRA